MKKFSVKKLALAGMFCALCVVGSVFSFPMFGSKCAPVQHMVNVLCAVLLGPWWGVGVAFVASLLRNILGLGSLMAFPGSMFGALLCGLVYAKTKNLIATLVGEMYGPVLKNNEWTMSRALDSKMVPDSVGVRHIVLPYAQEALADSLLTVLKKGGDFAQTAARYSVYDATAANGGEVGVLPFSAFTGEFAAALANARQGDIVKIASGDAIQLMQVYRADKPSKHVQVATITYPVEASAATRRDVHNQAGSFMVNAKGSAAAFADAASTAAVTPRVAAIAQGDRTIRGLEDSREVARWAYGAKEGDLSAIFNVGKDYVIATLTEIDDNEYAPLNKVSAQIRSQLLRDKKYDYIVKSLSGSTLAEQAASLGSEVEDFSDVTFGSFYVNGVGMEPRLVGAIASAEKGALSAPVKGLSGVYVFEVGDVKTDDKQTAEGEKVRAQAMAEGMAQQFAIPAIQQMAKIQDLRGKYF